MRRLLTIPALLSSLGCTAQRTEIGISIGAATSLMAPGKEDDEDYARYYEGYKPLYVPSFGLRVARTVDTVWQLGIGVDIYNMGARRPYANGNYLGDAFIMPLSSIHASGNRRWNGKKGYGFTGIHIGLSRAKNPIKTSGFIAGVQGGYKFFLSKKWLVGAEVFARYNNLLFKDVSWYEPDVDVTLRTFHYGASLSISRHLF